jgi:hypothetical protein
MRFTVVIPADQLDKGNDVSIFDEEFPAVYQEPIVAAIDEILVVGVSTVVLLSEMKMIRTEADRMKEGTNSEEPRRNACHICLAFEVTQILVVVFRVNGEVASRPC